MEKASTEIFSNTVANSYKYTKSNMKFNLVIDIYVKLKLFISNEQGHEEMRKLSFASTKFWC